VVAIQFVPQDQVLFAALCSVSIKKKIRHVQTWGNFVAKYFLPFEWAYNAMDVIHLKGIDKRYRRKKLKLYTTVNFFNYYFGTSFINRITVKMPLNYWPYNKRKAIQTLVMEVGFRYYVGKHYESRFTKGQNLQYRPMKFSYDGLRA